MEADWEVEIGGSAPVIEAHWVGFIDLCLEPERAVQLPEVIHLPFLADMLVRLNAPASPVWTSKCDVWHPEAFDPDELDAPAGAAQYAIACYIDLLSRSRRAWSDPERTVAQCQALCAHLREIRLRGCRADLIVRQAAITPGVQSLGITAYFTACGPAPQQAGATLALALDAFAASIANIGRPAEDASTLQ